MEQALLAQRPSVHVRPRSRLRVAAFVALVATLACVFVAACSPPQGTQPAPPIAAPAVARRVVSLAPTFTETLIAVGASDAIVGIGRFDPEVPGRPGVPRLGDTFTVSLETVLALEPDLVVVNSRTLADTLRPASARFTILTPPTDGLEDAIAVVGELGRRTGHAAEGDAVVARIRASLDAARSRAAKRREDGTPVPNVLVVVQRRPLYAAGRTSFVAELLRAVGAANAADDVEQPWPMLSEEAAVARAPDVILDASEGDNATPEGRAALLESWRRFPSIPAVRDGRVLVIREDSIFRAGPRIPEALARLEELLYPAPAPPPVEKR